MLRQPAPGSIDRLVLASVEAGSTTVPGISARVGHPVDAVRETVTRLARAGMVAVSGDVVAITEAGRLASTHIETFLPPRDPNRPPTLDLNQISRFMQLVWSAGPGPAAVETKRRRHENLLASHADRDRAVNQLSEAFAQGRLTSGEFEERTGRALTARTYGELDTVFEDLGGWRQPLVRAHPVRKVVFWFALVLAAPMVLLGVLLLLFGVESDDRVGGIFFLVLFLPGLVALGRWAWRRT